MSVPIAPIQLTDDLGSVAFEPRADITPYELALIVQLFAAMLLGNKRGTQDWRAYLEEPRKCSAGDAIVWGSDPAGWGKRALMVHFKEVR